MKKSLFLCLMSLSFLGGNLLFAEEESDSTQSEEIVQIPTPEKPSSSAEPTEASS